jgi:hypothetical protein
LNIDPRDILGAGALSGILWGMLTLTVNSMTGAFPFEASLALNLSSFCFAGALFGVVSAGFLAVLEKVLPFKRVLLKAAVISGGIWVIVFGSTVFLALNDTGRYHFDAHQGLQGFSLSLVMGALLAFFWRRGRALKVA